jgi:predicted CXXCH cytochrome family protein
MLVCLLVLVTSGARAAMPTTKAVVKPDHAVDPAGCVTAECHASVKAYAAIHAPITMNACDNCHKLVDVATHKYEVRRQGAELCTYCHEFNVTGVPVVHMPVAKGECLGCHNPHGGVDRRLTREQSTAELCARCHDSVTKGREHVHDPVTKGQCDSCHVSHASRFPKLLYAEGDALCLSCHTQLATAMAESRSRHEAMKEGCGRCHEAHASQFAKALKQPIVELCTGCHEHENVKQVATTAKYKHTVVTAAERACMTCHTAHNSNLVALLADLPIKLCMNCHDAKINTDRGTVIAALPELKDPESIKHGPVNDGQCAGCHQSHGSDQQWLLVRANSDALYQAMAPDNYKLCFSCHDARLGEEERTASATHFRNGDLNLHYIHVNRGNRGRNCRVCHSTHASRSAQHVNDTVQYGKWQMPIGFRKTETGGTCVTGCHTEYPYDRVHATTRPTTRPTTGAIASVPATGPAAMASTAPPRPAPLNWALSDVRGKALAVPAAGRPSVLIFLRTGSVQQPELLRILKKTVPDDRRAQVILILGGDEPAVAARRLLAESSKEKSIPWPIVADATDEYFTRLQVHVWPTTVVVQEDGTQLARIAGVPDSLPVMLAAHLDFASGKLDRDALTRRLAAARTSNAGPDDPNRRVARQLSAADRLLHCGDTAGARKVLAQALGESPDSVPLQVALLHVVMKLGDFAAGTELLNQLPPTALAAGEADVLRARICIDQLDPRRATEFLGSALRADGDLAEAHYLLGVIHERDGDWKKAAEEYRAAHDLGQHD